MTQDSRPARGWSVSAFQEFEPTFRMPSSALHLLQSCDSLEVSKKRGKFKGRRWGALERRQSNVDRTIPGTCQGYGVARGADRTAERANQLFDDASQVARQGPCIAPGADHDGQQAAAFAGLSQPPRPGSVSPDCRTP